MGVRLIGLAALGVAIGACAAITGLDQYATSQCATGCSNAGSDGSVVSSPEAADDDASSPDVHGADAVEIADGPDGGGCSGRLVACDSGCVDGSCGVTDAGADAADAAREAAVDASDGGGLALGLVALYRFDETSGTTAADASGHGGTATLVGGATFAAGLQNNAVSMSGTNQYVRLPGGIVNGLTSFSVCAWVDLGASSTWSRIFDFGTGTTAYMFLTPNSSAGTLRFSITTGGNAQEQQLNAPALPTASWQHVTVTLAANTGTLYVNGSQVAQNTNMTFNPASLGTTTQDWLGRSEYAGDPYLNGQIDNFRIYDRALTAAEVQTIYTGHL